MSTKTLRKRIALVAVSALGFGLLSSFAPANAVTIALTVTSTARAGVGATINFTSDSATTTEIVHWSLLSGAPTGGTLATGKGTLVATTGGSKFTASVAHETSTNNLVAGTYTLLVWANAVDNTSGAGGAYPNITDVSTTHTMTVAGAPSSVAVTSPSAAVAAGSIAQGVKALWG